MKATSRKVGIMTGVQDSEVVLRGPDGEAFVRKTPGICGGDACVGNTRIMVWLLVGYRKQGVTDAQLLQYYPGLASKYLTAAWEYYRLHPDEIDQTLLEVDELNRPESAQ